MGNSMRVMGESSGLSVFSSLASSIVIYSVSSLEHYSSSSTLGGLDSCFQGWTLLAG
jgi:hypothetical protein